MIRNENYHFVLQNAKIQLRACEKNYWLVCENKIWRDS
ncbi:MAG: hypothetical protein ACI8VT_003564 [Saprospiraceae bacterium]|jgi:hypothetical protein